MKQQILAKLTPPSDKKRVTFYLSNQNHSKFIETCKKANVPASQVIEKLIQEFMKE